MARIYFRSNSRWQSGATGSGQVAIIPPLIAEFGRLAYYGLLIKDGSRSL